MKKQKCRAVVWACPPKKKDPKQKKEKGITLIALVITVIVLLILAGITLKLIVGSDGIIGKAEKAVENQHNASIKEELELLVAEVKMEYFSNHKNQTNTDFIKYFQEYIRQNDLENITLKDDGECTFTSSSGHTKVFTIGKDGEVKEKERGIALDKTNIEIKQGNTETIQVSLIDVTGKILFESADPNIAMVNDNGLITAIDKGKTTIIVKIEGTDYAATCEVIVTIPVKLTGLVVENMEVVVGQPKKIKVLPQPKGAEVGDLIYELTDARDCSVDDSGFVLATVRWGYCGTVKIQSKNDSSISTSCRITATNSIRETEIGGEAFDQDENTYFEIKPAQYYEFLIAKLPINSNDYGKNININLETRYGSGPDQDNSIYFYDVEGKRIQNIGTDYSVAGGGTSAGMLSYVIPEDCAYVQFEVRNCTYGTWMRLKEITIN